MILKNSTLLFIAAFLCFQNAFVVSEEEEEDSKLIRGRNVSRDEFPYMISVQTYTSGGTLHHICSGVLMTLHHIMTLASCMGYVHFSYYHIEYIGTDDLVLFAGNRFINTKVSTIPDPDERLRIEMYLRHYFIHPEFDHTSHYGLFINDVVVMITKEELIAQPNVSPISVYSSNKQVYELGINDTIQKKIACTLAGWGSMNGTWNPHILWGEAGSLSEIMQMMTLTLMDDVECSSLICLIDKNYCNMSLSNMNQLCAMPIHKNQHACKGDRGGVLVCNGSIFGILSWYMRCGWYQDTPMMFQSLGAIGGFYNMYSFQKHYSSLSSLDRAEPWILLFFAFVLAASGHNR